MKLLKKAMALILALTMCAGLLSLNAFALNTSDPCPNCGETGTLNWSDAVAATCDREGKEAGYYCSACKWTSVKTIEGTRHPKKEYNGYLSTEPTCGEAGTEVYYCPDCRQFLYEPGDPATGNHANVTPGTCVAEGFCWDCKQLLDRDPSSHIGTTYWALEGTDHVKYCNDCKKEIGRHSVEDCTPSCPMNGQGSEEHEHKLPAEYPNGWAQYKAPTCTEPGYYTYTCRDEACHKDFNVEISKLGHTFESAADLITEVPATCKQEGMKAHYHCDRCGKDFGTGTTGEITDPAQLVIAKLPHTPGEMVRENVVPATTTEDGSHDEVVYCIVCEGEISRVDVTDPATGADPAPAPGTGDLDPFTPGDDSGDVQIDDVAVPLAGGPVTRAEFVDYLWRHEDEPDGSAPTFMDVSADHEFVLAIGWGQMIGIIYGRGNNDFAPDELVTVSDVRLILDRFAIWKGLDVDVSALVTLTGEDDDIVMNCDEVVAEFFGEEYVAEADAA